MSDEVPPKFTKAILEKKVSAAGASDNDSSNSAGSMQADLLKPPRSPWGRSGMRRRQSEIVTKRKHTSDSDTDDEECDGLEGENSKPSCSQKPADDPADESICPEDQRPTDPEFLEVERYFPSSSEDEEKDGDDTATVDYATKNVLYEINLKGSIPICDQPVNTENTIPFFLSKILASKVEKSCDCKCHIPGSAVSDVRNENKEFVTADKSMTVKCNNPESCNLIDITGATYLAEREKSAREVIRLRNRAINFGDEDHYYMGQKIDKYTDYVHVGGYIHLYALMGPDGNDCRLFKKDACNIFLRR